MEGKNYPFVSPSSDLDYLIADFYLSVEHSAILRPPFSIVRIKGLEHYLTLDSSSSAEALTIDTNTITADNNHITVDQTLLLEWLPESSWDFNPLDVFVEDVNGNIVFASVLADYYQAYNYGTDRRLHEWIFYGVGFCRLIQYTSWPEDIEAPVIPDDLYPTNGILDPHTYDMLPKRLKAVQIEDDYYQGDIVLRNGFNTELFVGNQLSFPQRRSRISFPTITEVPGVTATDGTLNETIVTMSAAPSSGLGKYPGCEDTSGPIYRINGVGPDEYGNFTLAAGDASTDSGACTYIRVTGEVLGNDFIAEPASLDIGDDCSVCCACSSYAKAYKAVRNNFLIIKDLVRRYHALREQIEAYATALQSRVDCDKANPLRLSAQVAMNFLDVIGAYVNLTEECVYDLTLNFDFVVRKMDGPTALDGCDLPEVTRCTAYAIGGQYKDWTQVTLDNDWPRLSFNFEYVKPYDAAGIQFRLEFPCQETHRVEVCLSATSSNGDVPSDESPAELCLEVLVPSEDCYPTTSSSSSSLG